MSCDCNDKACDYGCLHDMHKRIYYERGFGPGDGDNHVVEPEQIDPSRAIIQRIAQLDEYLEFCAPQHEYPLTAAKYELVRLWHVINGIKLPETVTIGYLQRGR